MMTDTITAHRFRVLVVHNAYRQRGGEDSVVDAEIALLRSRGHDVELYSRHNDDLLQTGAASAAMQTVWSRRTQADIAEVVARFRPDVMHVHNTFPLISPSVYVAAEAHRLPVVQTLHNFRLLCPQAMFLRQGRVCEDCLGRLPWRGVMHGCYRNSRAQTTVLATMLTAHRWRGTYRHQVSRYIALNDFCRKKFIAGGLPADRIVVKPNFVPAPDPHDVPRNGGLFVGRLSEEKGIDTLLAALDLLPDYQLNVVGSGPLEGFVEYSPRARLLGFLPAADIFRQMHSASYLVLPSIWYENFPRTLVEAFACGLPVIASRLGALAELVEEGKTGLLFDPGSADDLARKLAWAEANPESMRLMGRRARGEYEARYTPDINYGQLMAIYAEAVSRYR